MLFRSKDPGIASSGFVQTPSGQLKLGDFQFHDLNQLILGLSWSHHTTILSRCDTPAARYFHIKMAICERWSHVRELRRQIDSDLFTRYVSVREHPEKCLPDEAESGDRLPFKDRYVLEFLGLEEEVQGRSKDS